MSETKSRGGRKALEPGEHGEVTITGHRADGTTTTGTAAYYKGRAWIGLEHAGRKRVQVRADTRTAVKAAIRARALELHTRDQEDYAATNGSVPATWEAAVLDHREWLTRPLANGGAGYSSSSQRVYRSAIDVYMLGERSPFKPERRLSSITRGNLEHWLAEIANSTEMAKRADGSEGKRRLGGEGAAKQVRAVVQGIFRRAHSAGVVKDNPARSLTFRRSLDVKHAEIKDRDHTRSFAPAELARVYAVADTDPRMVRNDMGDLVRFLVGTGCRIGEALAMTWEHVNLEKGTVTVASTASRVAGEGIKLGRTKTEKSKRTLEVPSSLVAILGERLERMTDPKHERPLIMGEERAVFPSSVGTLRDSSNTNEEFRYLFEAAGVPWATTHTCRTTTANLLDSAGYRPREIAARLGNSVETLMRHYFDDQDQGRGVAEALEEAAFKPAGPEKVDTEVDTDPEKPRLNIVRAS